MNKKMFGVLVLAGTCLLNTPRVPAQAAGAQQQGSLDQDITLLRKDIASQKKQLIAANLSLTDTEATKFWPIYDQYQAEYNKLGDAKLSLIKDYAQIGEQSRMTKQCNCCDGLRTSTNRSCSCA